MNPLAARIAARKAEEQERNCQQTRAEANLWMLAHSYYRLPPSKLHNSEYNSNLMVWCLRTTDDPEAWLQEYLMPKRLGLMENSERTASQPSIVCFHGHLCLNCKTWHKRSNLYLFEPVCPKCLAPGVTQVPEHCMSVSWRANEIVRNISLTEQQSLCNMLEAIATFSEIL